MLCRILTICLVFIALALSGCAFMSDEDRDFYGKGWVHPSDLDKEPPARRIPDPMHQDEVPANVSTAAPRPTPPEFLVPETADNPTGAR